MVLCFGMGGTTMDEKQEAKEYLKLDNFRKLTADHAISLVSTIKEMKDKSVEYIMDKVPNVIDFAKDSISHQLKVFEKLSDKDKERSDSYVSFLKQIQDSLQKDYDNENTSREEKERIMDNMFENAEKIKQEVDDGRSHDKQLMIAFYSAVALSLCVLASIMGVDIDLTKLKHLVQKS